MTRIQQLPLDHQALYHFVMNTSMHRYFLIITVFFLVAACFRSVFYPPPDPIRPPDIERNRAGNCDSIDVKLFKNVPNFASTWRVCATDTWGNAQKTIDCIRESFNLTERCASCFGNFTACGAKNCKGACWLDPKAEKCADCGRSYCGDDWASCTGVPISDLPR